MKPISGNRIQHGTKKRSKREKGERRADKKKGRQMGKRLCVTPL